MITMRSDLPENVLGADASGTVTAQDYETVLVPAIQAFAQTHAKIRGERVYLYRAVGRDGQMADSG